MYNHVQEVRFSAYPVFSSTRFSLRADIFLFLLFFFPGRAPTWVAEVFSYVWREKKDKNGEAGHYEDLTETTPKPDRR